VSLNCRFLLLAFKLKPGSASRYLGNCNRVLGS